MFNFRCFLGYTTAGRRNRISHEGTSCLNSVVHWETVEADLIRMTEIRDVSKFCESLFPYIIPRTNSWQNTGAWGTPCTRKGSLNSLNDINPTLKTYVNKIIGTSHVLLATFILLRMVTDRIATCTQQVGGIAETKYLVWHMCLIALWKLKTCCV